MSATGGSPGSSDPHEGFGERPAVRLLRRAAIAALVVASGAVALLPEHDASRSPHSETLSARPVEPTATPAPWTPAAQVARTAGAARLGTTAYPVPGSGDVHGTDGQSLVVASRLGAVLSAYSSSAVYVSPRGSNSASGSVTHPVRTVARAIALAPSGGTVVLRAGSYHESVTLNKNLTLQSYPGEAAWLEGSRPVGGFVRSGRVWVRPRWKVQFSSSPTYARGARDGTAPGWRWINPAYPMAAHPDQVWVDGRPQRQVGARSAVGPGRFYVDYARDKLVLGSDPRRRSVRASDLRIGLTVTAAGSVVRGIGIRRFAPSVPDMGTLRMFAPWTTAENVVVSDNATSGVTVYARGVTLRHVSSVRNGFVGFHAHKSDDLMGDHLLASGNNRERFNAAPAASGFKITSSRRVTVADSVFKGNFASGLWFDSSVYDAKVLRNQMLGNTHEGLIFELSAKLLAVGNRMRGNRAAGILVLDAGQLRIWNNTITGSRLPIRVSDSSRVATDTKAPGHDSRQPLPDPTVTWVVQDVEIKNNVVGHVLKGNNWCGVVCILDDRRISTAQQMRVTLDGNVYHRIDAGSPTRLVRWANGSAGATNYSGLAAFTSARGQEAAGAEVDAPTLRVPAEAGLGVPSDIAPVLGVAAGTRTTGAR